jgi:hypothetical protein
MFGDSKIKRLSLHPLLKSSVLNGFENGSYWLISQGEMLKKILCHDDKVRIFVVRK